VRWDDASTQNHNKRNASLSGIKNVQRSGNKFRWRISRTVNGEVRRFFGMCSTLDEAQAKLTDAKKTLYPELYT
jgi:hypothetical protein